MLDHSIHNLPSQEKSEGEVLVSIRAIIIMSKGGIPYFEDRYDDFEFDGTLLAGITSALSTYMDTFTHGMKFGFESMKNAGLTISSHKSELSTIVIVSEFELSLEVINQIRKAQILLDRKFKNKLEGIGTDRSLMDPILVYEMFETAGFKIGFKKVMTIHVDYIDSVMKDRQINPTLRFHLKSLKEIADNLPTDINDVSLKEIRSHFDGKLNEKDIANLLVLAYERRVLKHRIPIKP